MLQQQGGNNMKEIVGFFTGSCLMIVFAVLINIAFWGGLIWFGLHMLSQYGVI